MYVLQQDWDVALSQSSQDMHAAQNLMWACLGFRNPAQAMNI